MKRTILTLMLSFFSLQLFALESETAIYAPFPGSADHTLAQGRFDIDPKLAPNWLHQITAIDIKAGTITLEDGSEWKLDYWHSGALNSWGVGDQVTVAWYEDTYFQNIRIKNYTAKSYVWCEQKETPQPDASGFTYIESMPNKMTVVLNNGARVTSKQAWMFSEAKVGDIVVTLHGNKLRGGTPYGLWNMNSRRVFFNLIVDAPAPGVL